MGHSAGQRSQGFNLLYILQLSLEKFALGDIIADTQDFNDPAGIVADRPVGPGNPGPFPIAADILVLGIDEGRVGSLR